MFPFAFRSENDVTDFFQSGPGCAYLMYTGSHALCWLLRSAPSVVLQLFSKYDI